MKDDLTLKQIFKSVYELPVYTFLDYDIAFKTASEKYDYYSNGGCSAVCKVCNNETIVGRNMDLSLSNKAAYIIKTSPKGFFKTVGVCYFNKFGDNVETIEKSRVLSVNSFKYAPFLCTDILNEKGFYIEVNMRSTELDKNGKSKFGCNGTNSKAKIRICETMLPRYLADKVSEVDEALNLLKELNIYSPNGNGLDWNLCFLVADASGKHGIIEIAQNKIVFTEYHAQTNFYLAEEFSKIEEFKAGIGRMNYINEHLKEVKDEKSMFNLINSVSYFQMYKDNCKFDPRSELVGDKPGWTSSFLLDDKNKEIVDARFNQIKADFKALSLKKIKDLGIYWASILTTVTNCNKNEMKVRFFENNKKIIKLHFDF